MSEQPSITIRLFNTVEPVTSMYRDIIPYWQALGWQVEVVISRAEYRAGRPKRWINPNIRVYWAPCLGLRAERPLSKLLIMLLYMVYSALLTLFGPNVQRNLFLTQPPLFFAWGAVLSRLRKQPYYIVLMDLYPDVAVQAGVLPDRGLLTRILLKVSRFGLQRATGVFVIGRDMRERLIAIGIKPARLYFVPNWADQEAIVPITPKDNRLRCRMGWQGKFVLMYSGNIGVSHFFDDILEVSRRLRHLPDLLFVFIGRGRKLAQIERFQAQHSLKNLLILPFQPQDHLADSLSAGDLHFVSLRDNFTGLVVPSKVYGVLAAGRPLIYQGRSDGEIARLVEQEDIGLVTPLNDPDRLEQAILSYMRDPDLVARQGRQARQLARDQYGKQEACHRYAVVLTS